LRFIYSQELRIKLKGRLLQPYTAHNKYDYSSVKPKAIMSKPKLSPLQSEKSKPTIDGSKDIELVKEIIQSESN